MPYGGHTLDSIEEIRRRVHGKEVCAKTPLRGNKDPGLLTGYCKRRKPVGSITDRQHLKMGHIEVCVREQEVRLQNGKGWGMVAALCLQAEEL